MENLLESLAATPVASWMRYSRWGYAWVNTAHVVGIALLIGAIVPLDLKMLGAWRNVSLEPLTNVLVPMAAGGLLLAITTGSLLFLADPPGYAGLTVFLVKIGLITIATLHAISFHIGKGFTADNLKLRLAGGCSLVLWLAVLILGRFIAFAGN